MTLAIVFTVGAFLGGCMGVLAMALAQISARDNTDEVV